MQEAYDEETDLGVTLKCYNMLNIGLLAANEN